MTEDLPSELRSVALHLCPDLSEILRHNSIATNSTWDCSTETGKAIEITAMCATISAFQRRGFTLFIPQLFIENPDLFYLRNIVPKHHDAQAGHDAAFLNAIPLLDRFVASLTPKAVLKDNELVFSIFREGHVIHKITHLLNTDSEYLDRPDIVIAQGEMDVSIINETEIEFNYNQPINQFTGKLRVKNDNKIPLISFDSNSTKGVLVNGIIECSVGKERAHAVKQTNRYKTLFASVIIPSTALVNGQKYSGNHIEHEIFLDLVEWDREKVISTLESGFDKFVEVIDLASRKF